MTDMERSYGVKAGLGVASLLLAMGGVVAAAQNTEVVIAENGKGNTPLTAQNVQVEVNGKTEQVARIAALQPAQTQVALLIDDGLRTSLGVQLNDLSNFVQRLQPGTQVLVGYMQNGRVDVAQTFTTDRAAAVKAIRLPLGSPGISASPYFCLEDFAKNWPGASEAAYGAAEERGPGAAAAKHRIVLMITNGVDPYNGSVSPLNQDSPYVLQAITAAQKANVTVYAQYYGGTNIRGGAANFSGQNYLNQVAQATGGLSLYNMQFNPVSLKPYLDQFLQALKESYVVAFDAPSSKDVSRFKVKGEDVKVRGPQAIKTGNLGS